MNKRLLLVVGWLVGVAVLGAAGCLLPADANASAALPYQGTSQSLSGLQPNHSSQWAGIWVTGEGKVTAVPDVAVLTLGVEVQASTVEEAMAQATAAMDRVIAALHLSC